MAEFVCRLGTPTGEVVTRTFEAAGERDLRTRLEREGFRVFSVAGEGAGGVRRLLGTEVRASKIKTEAFLLFNQQLSALLRAGLPILQAIAILRKRVPNERLKMLLENIEDKVRAGNALSEAFAAQGDAFPRIYIASILAASDPGRWMRYCFDTSVTRRRLPKCGAR